MKKYAIASFSIIFVLVLASIFPIIMLVKTNNELTITHLSRSIVQTMTDGYFIGVVVLYSIIAVLLIAFIITSIIYVCIKKNIRSYRIIDEIKRWTHWW